MLELIRKELKLFFASLSGYIVLTFFLLATGLFLWIFPGRYNIPMSGMADLQPFFSLAPMLYLFLVPVVCMRLFAEEKRSGTLELLLTRPVAVTRIVIAKYVAGLVLVLLSILPTLIYVYSLSHLAQPMGHIDMGGIVGSYVGLAFLSAIYVAIGLWASAVTENQIVAFVMAFLLSFIIYSGFDMVAQMPALDEWSNTILAWGISFHYEPMSRGVITVTDVVYFVTVVVFFLWLTVRRFQKTSWKSWWFVGALIIVNALSTLTYARLDITDDRRYTLSDNTQQLIEGLDEDIQVDIFLAGNLPAGIEKLQYATTRMLEEFRRLGAGVISYEIINPNDITDLNERKKLVQYLAARGIMPVNLNRTTDDETLEQQIVFPGLLMYDDSTEVSVPLLQNVPGNSGDENIRSSIEALEYELTRAIRLMRQTDKKSVAFLTGHGEVPYREIADISRTLLYYYNVDFVSADTLGLDPFHYDALVVACPTHDISERDKYIIDQYIMHGGRVLWCVDEAAVNEVELKTQETTYAVYRPLNIEDMLFKYGVRINPDILLDGNCALIPVVTNVNNGNPEYSPAPWYYSPLLYGMSRNPVTAGIQPVRVEYANSIDTVGGSSTLRRTVLLASSENTASMKTPCPVTLSIVEEKMTEDRFNKRNLPVAVLLEDNFKSMFQFNRRAEDAFAASFAAESGPNRMIVVSDGDVLRNKVHGVGDAMQVVPLGYDEYSGTMYGNRDFIVNCINYLCDDEGWMELRGRNLSLYLLNKTKLKTERSTWIWMNVCLPIAFVLIGGLIFWLFRRKRY